MPEDIQKEEEKQKVDGQAERSQVQPTGLELSMVGRICFICNGPMTEKQWKERRNWPVKAEAIPGYVHRRCRGDLTDYLISNPTGKSDLSGMAKSI